MASSGTGPVLGSTVTPLQQEFKHPMPLAEASSLPTSFPVTLDSQLAWAGQQFADESQFVHSLNEQDLQEIDAALEQFKALGLDGDLACRDNFPLPTVGPKLDRLRQDIHNGKGFGVIRGLDPKKYAVEDLTVLYLGLQSYIANRQGRQDKKGNMLVHIIADDSTKTRAEHHRHSTSPITFHNEEAGDIISWLTRNTALSGGKCIISSAYTVYNVLAATRPDLIRTLARSDWPFALPKFQCRPVMFYQEGRLITNFGRAALIGSASHARPAHLPKLTCSQLEALDAIEKIAEATRLEFKTQAGDIHFINNLAILHRRDGFINGTASNQRRHLVRMRLRDDEMGWNIPQDLQHEWNKAFGPAATRVWHLEPMPSGFFPLRSQPN
ncbi:Taurine hydroxylase-like protein SAT17 [Cladobotryum mycophilum]|uniref:Taurine hydroxylase-like protein SAT17 n=1 Tax=Cladobotryum mycophilum TaxID=491253 RepID=A0ABR0SEV6_9HYPO